MDGAVMGSHIPRLGAPQTGNPPPLGGYCLFPGVVKPSNGSQPTAGLIVMIFFLSHLLNVGGTVEASTLYSRGLPAG